MMVSNAISAGLYKHILEMLNKSMQTSKMLRLALIGAGRWGQRYISTIKENQYLNVQLSHVISRQSRTFNLVSNDTKVLENWQALSSSMTDAVIIAVPPKFHASIAAKFLREGVPVMIEKPLALSMKDADLLLELEHTTGTPILVNHTQLFHPAYFKVREIIAQWAREGSKIHCIHLQSGAFGPFRDSWTVLWDWSPHDVALALNMMGLMPDTVSALGNDHSVMIKLTFANGCEVHIANSNIASYKYRCYGVYSDKEIIYFDDIAEDKLCRISLQSFSPILYAHERCLPITYAHANTKPLTNAIEYFVGGLRGGNTKEFGLDFGVNVVRVLSRAQDSLKS